MNMPNAPSPLCVQCTAGEVDDIEQALLRCNKIKPGSDFFIETLKSEIPDLTLEHMEYLDVRSEDLFVPVCWNVEQSFMMLKKSRFTVTASKLHNMWKANVLLVHDIVENTSLAAPGGLAHRLQHHTVCNTSPPA